MISYMDRICCFAGHSKIYHIDDLYDKLVALINELITSHNISEFYVGNYGDFDKLCAKAVRSLKEKYPHIQLTLVIPYLTSEINEYREEYYKKYDGIIMADLPDNVPKKLKIIKCNEYMVNSSDFIICYVKKNMGGAYKTVEYAKKKKDIAILSVL